MRQIGDRRYGNRGPFEKDVEAHRPQRRFMAKDIREAASGRYHILGPAARRVSRVFHSRRKLPIRSVPPTLRIRHSRAGAPRSRKSAGTRQSPCGSVFSLPTLAAGTSVPVFLFHAVPVPRGRPRRSQRAPQEIPWPAVIKTEPLDLQLQRSPAHVCRRIPPTLVIPEKIRPASHAAKSAARGLLATAWHGVARRCRNREERATAPCATMVARCGIRPQRLSSLS